MTDAQEADRPHSSTGLTTEPSPDRVIAARLLPVLAAAALGLVPFTVFSTFLVEIAAAAGEDPATLGGLRGLGGVSAVAVGIAYALVAQRLPARAAIVIGLGATAVFCVIATFDGVPLLVLFCLGIGAATSILNPALQSTAAALFQRPADQGRAATMVTATTTLTAMLAAPVLGGLSLLVGWRGVLWITAAVAAVLAVAVAITAARARPSEDTAGARPTTTLALASVLRDPWTTGLLATSLLRTAAFMGALAVVAAIYAERHGLVGAGFTPVWTLSGLAFFVANWGAGRLLARRSAARGLLWSGVAAGLVGLALVFLTEPLWLMLAGTAILAGGHAAIAAAVTTDLARLPSEIRSSALAANGVGQSIGTFAGATVASLGAVLGGWFGVAVALMAVTLAGLVPVVVRRGRSVVR